jgi:hypothetical protein
VTALSSWIDPHSVYWNKKIQVITRKQTMNLHAISLTALENHQAAAIPGLDDDTNTITVIGYLCRVD